VYATALNQGNYPAGVAEYDKVEVHRLEMVDVFSIRLLAAFPDKLKS
jgi:hypothetical protein